MLHIHGASRAQRLKNAIKVFFIEVAGAVVAALAAEPATAAEDVAAARDVAVVAAAAVVAATSAMRNLSRNAYGCILIHAV